MVNGDDGSGNGSGIDINAACDTEPPADNYGDDAFSSWCTSFWM